MKNKEFLRFFRAVLLSISLIPFVQLSSSGKEFSFPNFPELYGGVAEGFGVNPNAADPSELLLPKGITYTRTTGPINPGNFSYKVDLIHEWSDVKKSLSASSDSQVKFYMFKGQDSLAIRSASHKTSDSVMWVVTADKDYGVREQLTNVKLNEVAQARLDRDGYTAFVKQFGTHFVSSWRRKAHLSVIFEVYNITQEDQSHVDAMINISINILDIGDINGKQKFENEVSSLSSSARTRVSFQADGIAVDNYFRGTTNLTQLSPLPSHRKLRKWVGKFV